MSRRTLTVDDRLHEYVVDVGVREHPVLAALRAETAAHPRAGMQISPEQGALLQMLVRLLDARRTIEVGVFTGYSSLAVALALGAGGRVLACDVSDEYTRVARRHWAAAGVADRIELVLQPATLTLDARLAAGEHGRYDFAFVDADKTSYLDYYERCLRLVRAGGLIAVDNTLWGGAVVDPADRSADTLAIRRFNEALAQDPRVDVALLPVGDGLTLARVRNAVS